MKPIVVILLIAVLGWANHPAAQGQSLADTLFLHHEQSRMEKFRSRPVYQITKSAIPLFAASALALTLDHRIKETRDFYVSDFGTTFDSYLQFVPAVTMLGMKLGGVKGRSTWAEMITADAISIATLASLVNGIKYTVKRERPDNSRRTSFPSGHTASAFAGAAALLIHSRRWGAVAMAYAILVGVSRLYLCVHWPTDVVVGAIVGIAVAFVVIWFMSRWIPFFRELDRGGALL